MRIYNAGYIRQTLRLPIPPQLPLHRLIRGFCVCPVRLKLGQVLLDRLINAEHGEVAARRGGLRAAHVVEPVSEQDRDVGRYGLNVRLVIEGRDLAGMCQ